MENEFLGENLPFTSAQHFRTKLGEIIGETFSTDYDGVWKNGEICSDVSNENQPAFLHDFPETIPALAESDWISSLIRALDKSLPDLETLFNSLEMDSLTIRFYSPAFRIPATPSTEAAAHCLFAARVLVACRDDIIPPALVTTDYVVDCLEMISHLAIMLGGEEAFLQAMSIAQDFDTYLIHENDGRNK